jgi:hypothetical protein
LEPARKAQCKIYPRPAASDRDRASKMI